MPSLRDLTKDRLIEMVSGVIPANGWKVLIVDNRTSRIINASCSLHEIMDEGVTIAEQIVSKRDRLTNMEAIYFLTPEKESIELLKKDFEVKHQYAAIHLFLTSRLPDDLFEIIKHPNVSSRIKTLKELNLDFLAYESQIFHFDVPLKYKPLFNPSSQDEHNAFLDQIAYKLMTVCITLETTCPLIRYCKDHPLSMKVAGNLQKKLEEYQIQAKLPAVPDPPTLLILDRSVDLFAPLLHEFTYQAMAYDLAGIQNERYVFTFVNANEKEEKKEVLLNESDNIWKELRHLHIAHTSEWVVTNFNKFMNENKKTLSHHEAGSLQEMSQLLKAMPQFHEMKTKFSLHLDIAGKCMSIFTQNQLERIARIEQDLAVDYSPDSLITALSSKYSQLSEIICDQTVLMELKVRLLVIYIISQGLRTSDRQALMRRAGLAPELAAIIENLQFLGLNLDKGDVSLKNRKREISLAQGPSLLSRGSTPQDSEEYELSRYVPFLKNLMELATKDKLPDDRYPLADEKAKKSGSRKKGSKSLKTVSRRKKHNTWANQNKSQFAPSLGGAEEKPSKGQIIVFVIGGITYSEIRSVYETMKATQYDIYLGSESIISPQEFLLNLKLL